MRLEYTSLTAHRCSLPSPVACSVMSVSHNRFGPAAVKSRRTRSPDRRPSLGVLPTAPALPEGTPPAVVPADPPGGPLSHRLTGDSGLVEKEAVTEFGIVAMRVEQGVGPVCLGKPGIGDR